MINKNIAGRAASFDGFAGMDASTPFGKGKTFSLRNFRLLPDGSIEKREGYRHLATLPDAARAVSVWEEDDEQVLLCVAGSYLCRVSEGGEVTSASVFSATEGNALFLRYGGELYILDGDRLYRYEGGVSVTAGEAYIPHLGKDWSCGSETPGGEYESPNLLSRRAYITYKSKDVYIYTCYFDRKVASVDQVYIGTQKVSPENYSLEDGIKLSFSPGIQVSGRTLKVHVTLDCDSDLFSATKSFLFEGLENNKLFLYGGDSGSSIYSGYAVADPTVTQVTDTSFPLYFPGSMTHAFSEGGQVNAVERLGRRLLVFSERGIYISKEAADAGGALEFAMLSKSVGCSSPEGLLVLSDDEVLSVDGSGVLRVTIDPSMERDPIIKRLSDAVRPAFGGAFLTGARLCYFRTRGEIWFADPSGGGEVFVYSMDGNCWYIYDGIRADHLLMCWGKVVFLEGQFINCFDEESKVDVASYGEAEINARFKSHYVDFGAPESDKRLAGLLMLATLDGGALEVRFSDGGYLAEFTVEGGAHPTFPYLYEKHLRSGRFRFASLELRAAGVARQRIFGAKVLV